MSNYADTITVFFEYYLRLLSLQTPPVSQTTKKKIYKLMDVVCRKAVSKENSESNQPTRLKG